MSRALTWLAKRTGRIWFWYLDGRTGTPRIYFGKADSSFIRGRR